jgi:RND family efflux transporter MFP subunit
VKRWHIILIGVLALAGTLGIGYLGYQSSRPKTTSQIQAPPTTAVSRCTVQQSINAPGSVVNTHEEGIQMPADGELAEILVRAGDAVKKDQVLARLKSPQKYAEAVAQARLALFEAQRALEEVTAQAPLKTAQAHADLLAAQKKLDQANTHRLSKAYQRASDSTIAIARANLMLAQAELEKTANVYDNTKSRPDNDPIKAEALSQWAHAQQEYDRGKANLDWLLTGPTDQEISTADTDIAVAQAQVDTARAVWNRVKSGPDALALDQAQAGVDKAQAALDLAQEVYTAVEIKAPFAGVITEMKASVGGTIPSGTTLMTINDPKALEVEATVVEEDLPLLSTGMSASLFFDAIPDANVTGKISAIIPRRASGDHPQYPIRTSIETVPQNLVAGMTADASIILAAHKNVLCLPRSVVHASGANTAQVEVWNGKAVEKRAISIGLRGDTTVEILSGLKEGELVVSK